ncbi:hypothetical protein FG147_06670 [Thauera sp. UPWRP]|nr:hypothetical protein FG147_06670 [Thauera sp. UPWRP]
MGGYGSGRRGGRDTTADYRRLDVRELHRAGVLTLGWRGGWCWYQRGEKRASINIEVGEASIRLRYDATSGGERKSFDYAVMLSRTSCNFGNARPWLHCPCCWKRCAVLYGGTVFACRQCRGLGYQVQREDETDRLARRADAIRGRLGWEVGILNGEGGKPRGMHWRTFWRLKAEHDRLKGGALSAWARRLGIMEGRIDKPRRR